MASGLAMQMEIGLYCSVPGSLFVPIIPVKFMSLFALAAKIVAPRMSLRNWYSLSWVIRSELAKYLTVRQYVDIYGQLTVHKRGRHAIRKVLFKGRWRYTLVQQQRLKDDHIVNTRGPYILTDCNILQYMVAAVHGKNMKGAWPVAAVDWSCIAQSSHYNVSRLFGKDRYIESLYAFDYSFGFDKKHLTRRISYDKYTIRLDGCGFIHNIQIHEGNASTGYNYTRDNRLISMYEDKIDRDYNHVDSNRLNNDICSVDLTSTETRAYRRKVGQPCRRPKTPITGAIFVLQAKTYVQRHGRRYQFYHMTVFRSYWRDGRCILVAIRKRENEVIYADPRLVKSLMPRALIRFIRRGDQVGFPWPEHIASAIKWLIR